MSELKIERAYLVYQAGIANVFAVDRFGLNNQDRGCTVRLMQGAFSTCESFARGLSVAGVIVRNAACNQAGNIAHKDWTADLESQPFYESFRPVGGSYYSKVFQD